MAETSLGMFENITLTQTAATSGGIFEKFVHDRGDIWWKFWEAQIQR